MIITERQREERLDYLLVLLSRNRLTPGEHQYVIESVIILMREMRELRDILGSVNR